MWEFIFMVLSSSAAKNAIVAGSKALFEHKEDGITKDVAIKMLDAIAMSQANNISLDAFDEIKKVL